MCVYRVHEHTCMYVPSCNLEKVRVPSAERNLGNAIYCMHITSSKALQVSTVCQTYDFSLRKSDHLFQLYQQNGFFHRASTMLLNAMNGTTNLLCAVMQYLRLTLDTVVFECNCGRGGKHRKKNTKRRRKRRCEKH